MFDSIAMIVKEDLWHIYEYVSTIILYVPTIILMMLILVLYIITLGATYGLVGMLLSKRFFGLGEEFGVGLNGLIVFVTWFYEFFFANHDSPNLNFMQNLRVMVRVSIQSTILFCTIGGFVYLVRYLLGWVVTPSEQDQDKQKEDEKRADKKVDSPS